MPDAKRNRFVPFAPAQPSPAPVTRLIVAYKISQTCPKVATTSLKLER